MKEYLFKMNSKYIPQRSDLWKDDDFHSRNLNDDKRILQLDVPKFHIDGEYLKQNGMQEGQSIGRVLKTIEDEWIKNGFKISDLRIKELIKANLN